MSVLHSLGFAGVAGIVVRLVLDQLAEIHRRHTKRVRRSKRAPRDGIPKLKPGTRVVLYGMSVHVACMYAPGAHQPLRPAG